MAVIYGKVVERFTQRPVVNATVSIGSVRVWTDNQGLFSADVPMGNYQIVVNHPNYRGSAVIHNLSSVRSNVGTITIDSMIRAL